MLWTAGTLQAASAVHFGIRVGVPVTEYFDTSHNSFATYTATTRRYVVGPAFEIRFRERFGIAADVLFTRMGYVGYIATDSYRAAYDSKGDSWDFPVIARWHSRARFAPFLGAGGAMRYIGPVHARGVAETPNAVVPIDTSQPSDLRKRTYPGVAVTGGLEFRAGPLRIQPECRYVRWTANIAGAGGLVRFGPNQITVIIGLLR